MASKFIKQAEKFVQDNSPLILTSIGVAGTITTAVLTGKATIRAAELIAHENTRLELQHHDVMTEPRVLSDKEKFELIWKLYIPAVGTAGFTCAAIIGANRVGTRRAAAMASAYAITERAFSEYKEKVIEKIGEKKELHIRDEIAQDRVDANPVGRQQVIITGGGSSLCYDHHTGRYFESSVEEIKKAMNDINYKINNEFYASLSDFYDRIGLARTKTSDEVGWNSDKLMDIQFSTTMSDDQRPCIAIDFSVAPIRNYFRIN